MGGNVAGMFSALYPEMVDAVVLLDSYGFLPAHVKKINTNLRKGIDELIEYDKKMDDKKERIYAYESAKERLKAANPSLSDQSVQILLERGVRQVDSGVVFTRDIRINLTNIARIDLDQSLQLQEQIQAKVLVLRATKGLTMIFPQPEEFMVAIQKGWEDKNNSIVVVEGDHHVHLNNPSVVAPLITEFLQSVTPEDTSSQAAKL